MIYTEIYFDSITQNELNDIIATKEINNSIYSEVIFYEDFVCIN